MSAAKKKIPVGLSRVRKELPPPGRIIASKKNKLRKRAKDELREQLKGSRTNNFF